MLQPVPSKEDVSLIPDNKEKEEIKCSQCGSNNLKKAGKYKDKQQYKCRDCRKQFVENPQRRVGHDGIKCPKCASNEITKSGKDNATNSKQRYRCKQCGKVFVDNPDFQSAGRILPKGITPEEMFVYDIWDIRVFGIEPSNANGQYTLNFLEIEPEWLKDVAKKWLWYRVARNDSASTLRSKLAAIRQISCFFQSHYPYLLAQDVNRDLIVDYLVYLESQQYKTGTKIDYISSIKQFLEECQRFNWADLPKENLIFTEDFPKKEQKIPRFIPNNIIKQLEDNLEALPKTVMCMVKILRETGMRISELCSLKLNCIREDSTGTWWIDIYQHKMKKEIPPIPISRELTEAIYDQQAYIVQCLGKDFPYLFCETRHRSSFSLGSHTRRSKYITEQKLGYFELIAQKLHPETVRGYLHRLAEERQIRDTMGNIFPLGKCHQFRHTHGTELINAGVPQHIVQKRLGHKSPEMTAHYASIHDKTMKREMEKFWDGKVVDIRGEVVISENPDLDTAEMQWIKKNMKAQALPNGFCGLPVTQSCPVQGSPCLVCSHFRTTKEHVETHKKQLENTENIIKNATAKGWHRQVETNEPIAQNLRNIIQGLEGDVNNA